MRPSEAALAVADANERRLYVALFNTLGRSPTLTEIAAAKRGPFIAIPPAVRVEV